MKPITIKINPFVPLGAVFCLALSASSPRQEENLEIASQVATTEISPAVIKAVCQHIDLEMQGSVKTTLIQFNKDTGADVTINDNFEPVSKKGPSILKSDIARRYTFNTKMQEKLLQSVRDIVQENGFACSLPSAGYTLTGLVKVSAVYAFMVEQKKVSREEGIITPDMLGRDEHTLML